ncbi:hypothetical protein [Brevundimonas lenta]|uniref:Uncharacterized protein n=1 Tax=Brevundimonas lenta TaxID=424796 RepID=A0A7W6JHN6_9CAUL|nr:hypothetical protein [Brevundimonas lenta]MBB4084343.1 hypothetical protein [Brevundimonas lenta]
MRRAISTACRTVLILGLWAALTASQAPTRPVDAREPPAASAASDAQAANALKVQLRAVEAAESQILPSWLGAILSFVGTCLVLWSLHIARASNAISRQALMVTREGTENAIRAYLEVGDYALMIDDRGLITPSFVLTNVGRTPARRVNVVWAVGELPAADAPNMDLVPTYAQAPLRISHLSAGGSVTPEATAFDPMLSDDDDMGPAHEAVVFGSVDYDDIFSDSVRHRTEFCAQVVIRRDYSKPDRVGWSFTPSAFHNATDDDCARPPDPW